jgi:hypothetical protein
MGRADSDATRFREREREEGGGGELERGKEKAVNDKREKKSSFLSPDAAL